VEDGISRKGLAARLGVTANTVWRWEKSGKSPVKPQKNIRTGKIAYMEEDVPLLREWMNKTVKS
jgi:transcriptional regulator with XRE-family HTH domain